MHRLLDSTATANLPSRLSDNYLKGVRLGLTQVPKSVQEMCEELLLRTDLARMTAHIAEMELKTVEEALRIYVLDAFPKRVQDTLPVMAIDRLAGHSEAPWDVDPNAIVNNHPLSAIIYLAMHSY